MKKAKVIITLQVLFLAVTIIFSTGIAYNGAGGQDTPPVGVTPNLAIRQQGLEVADPAHNQFQAQLASMDSMLRALEEVSQGRVPAGAQEMQDMPGAYLVPFTVDAQQGQGASQANESALVVMSRNEIQDLPKDSSLSALMQGVNVYLPAIPKASSAGLVVPQITPVQLQRVLNHAKQNLGIFGQHLKVEPSSLGTLYFESPVFQKRDVKVPGQAEPAIIGSVTTDGRTLSPKTPLTQVTSQDSVRKIRDLAKVMSMPESITSSPLADNSAYYMLRGLFASEEDMVYAFDEKGMRFDITAMVPATVYGELMHTSGHYHNPLVKPEIYMVVSGTAIYLLQQHDIPAAANRFSEDELKTKLAHSKVIRSVAVIAQPGQPVVIPAGWGHVTVNPSLTEPLVMVNWLTYKQTSTYGPYEAFHGPSHRIITDQKNNLSVVPNAHYSQDIPFSFATPKDVAQLGLVEGKPLYDILRDKEVFGQLSDFLDKGETPGVLGVGELSVKEIDNVAAAKLLNMANASIDMQPKASSAGYQEGIDNAIMHVSGAQEAFTSVSTLPDLNPVMLDNQIKILNRIIEQLKKISTQSPEATAAAAKDLNRIQASLDIISTSGFVALAAKDANIEQIKGTIIINEKEIPQNQQILLSMLDKSSPYLLALEAKLGCKVRLLSQYNSKTDGTANMIAISNVAVEGISKRININSITQDGYLPLEQIIILAKGLLAYNPDTKPALDSIISQMYRFITKAPLSPGLLEAYLQNSLFMLNLPIPVAIDEAYYEQLHRQALAALIAA